MLFMPRSFLSGFVSFSISILENNFKTVFDFIFYFAVTIHLVMVYFARMVLAWFNSGK